MNWPYDHPRRGTCEPGCPSYGSCHCGCDRSTSLARWNRNYDDGTRSVKGRPMIFVCGHKAPDWKSRGCMANGVPRAKLLPYFQQAIDQAGGVFALALRIGMPEGTVYSNLHHARNGRGRCSPEFARRVLLVAHGYPPESELRRHADGTVSRLPSEEERDKARRYAGAEIQRYNRRKAALKRQWVAEGQPAEWIREQLAAVPAPVMQKAYRDDKATA